jgi:GT2 family glycosyltransferase
VIVNWNGAQRLRICLPSLLARSHEALLRLTKNVGLAPALNRGAEIAAGSVLLLVDNDIVGAVK